MQSYVENIKKYTVRDAGSNNSSQCYLSSYGVHIGRKEERMSHERTLF